MPLKFNYQRTLQAVSVLLRRSGPSKSDNYMRLIKLLYIADRESLKETGRPITGDSVVAMERGPVLSHVLGLIKGQSFNSPDWEKFIVQENYNIRLINDPGNEELCPYEIKKLQEVWDRYRSKDEWDMVEITHELPEWKKNDPGNSAKKIPLADILEAVGRIDALEEIERQANESVALDSFFAE